MDGVIFTATAKELRAYSGVSIAEIDGEIQVSGDEGVPFAFKSLTIEKKTGG